MGLAAPEQVKRYTALGHPCTNCGSKILRQITQKECPQLDFTGSERLEWQRSQRSRTGLADISAMTTSAFTNLQQSMLLVRNVPIPQQRALFRRPSSRLEATGIFTWMGFCLSACRKLYQGLLAQLFVWSLFFLPPSGSSFEGPFNLSLFAFFSSFDERDHPTP